MTGAEGTVAVIAHGHPELHRGGAELAAHALFRGLRAIGRRAIFVAAVPEADMARLDPRPDEFAIPRAGPFYDLFYHTAPDDTAARLAAILRQEGVATAFFHHYLFLGLEAFAAAAATGARVVLTLHEYMAICHNEGQMVTRPHKALCRAAGPAACHACFPDFAPREFAIRRAHVLEAFAPVHRFVAPSRFLRDRHVAWGLPAGRIAVIENGLVETPEPEAPGPAAAPRAGGPVEIGYFGQITPFKGVNLLLDAAAMLDRTGSGGVRLRVHGTFGAIDAAFRARFEAAVAAGLIDYAGPYANADVAGLMRRCDYVVVPSLWWENSPLVVQEAYAAGRPVIAADLGGLAEKVIDRQTGLLFRAGSVAALLAAFETARDPGLAAALRAGLPRPQSAADMARAYLALAAG